jgi:tetratricopeptide (TPR) repeat protein
VIAIRTWTIVLSASVLAGAATAASQDRRAPGSGMRVAEPVEAARLERLERWIKAVARHVPGEEDAALAEIAGWPNANLKQLYLDANALIQTIGRIGFHDATATLTVRPVDQKASIQIHYSKQQFFRLQVLACAGAGLLFEQPCMVIKAADQLDPELRKLAALASASNRRGDRNYLIRHAALLHSDVPVLAPAAMAAPGRVGQPAGGFVESFRMEISDGQQLGLQQSAVHWDLARMLLDLVLPRGTDHPDPGHDDMVRDWYRATAAWMQLKEDHDKLHLTRARQLFPSDPDILFLSATQRETYAGAPIQAAVNSASLPAGVVIDVWSDRFELSEAAGLFRRTLQLKPDFAEARLRYGRVLDLLGKHAEAATELRKAIGSLADRQMLYYAGMFLGAAEEALGNRDAARVSYEESAKLYEMAQSPWLALSQLARRSGDRPGALRAIERVFALQADDRNEKDDPWWWYYVAQGRDAQALLDAMQQPYRSEVLQ